MLFTKEELEILDDLTSVMNLCEGGCYYEEMQNSKTPCDQCKLTLRIDNIREKLGFED